MKFSAQPYPGLRPFDATETDIFFGRERQTDALLAKLEATRFIAVLGASGCGKSSLVRAGLVPALETGFMAAAGARWEVVVMRPGGSPMAHLASALVAAPTLGVGFAADPSSVLSVAVNLRRGPKSLVELLVEAGVARGRNVCLVVDQFEELFRFNTESGLDESQAFVDLLLSAANQRELDVYVVVTMRSDYLGESSQLFGLPQAINDGLYLAPQLTREEAAEAIVGPARVCGGDVDSRLVNQLLNDFGPGLDSLPLLQHVLMRMWHQGLDAPSTATKKLVLRVEDYQEAGGLSEALSRHADSVMSELTSEQQRIAKVMFQRLTLRDSGRDRRSPASVLAVAHVANVSTADVIAVADAFRRDGRSFLMPPETEQLSPAHVLDIGHESLIRKWRALEGWAYEEAQNADLFRQLVVTAEFWTRGQAALWRKPDLERAQVWQQTVDPRPAWAARYGTEAQLPTVMRFIEESSEAERAREHEDKKRRDRQLHRTRLWAVAFALLAAMLGAGYLVYFDLNLREHSVLCNDFVRRQGIPQCVGELTDEAATKRALSFRIIRKGHFGRVVELDVVDSLGKPSPAHSLPTYIGYASEAYDTRRETTFRYRYETGKFPAYPDGKLATETAFDKGDKQVWEFRYEAGKDPLHRMAYYIGLDGFPKVPADGPEVLVEVEYDHKGNEVAMRYRTREDTPIPARDDAYGQRREYDANGRMITLISLDASSKPMKDSYGNAYLRMQLDALGNVTKRVALDADGRPTQTKEGWATETDRYDEFGRAVESAYFDERGQKTTSTAGYHRVTTEYDERGNPRKVRHFSEDDKPASSSEGCFGYELQFHPILVHYTVRSTCLGADGRPTRNKDGVATWLFTPDDQGNTRETAALDADGKPTWHKDGYAKLTTSFDADENQVALAYFGVDGKPTMRKEGYSSWRASYNHLRQQISVSYFDSRGKPVVRPDLGYSTVKRLYISGQLAKESLFDASGKPTVGRDGNASIEYTRDALGRIATEATFGPDGVLLARRNGYAVISSEYNAAGFVVRRVQRSPTWQAVADKTGVAEWRYEYNNLGKVTEARFYGEDGQPVVDKDGDAGWRQEYDARGNVVLSENFDGAGALAANANGIARSVSKFDLHDNEIARDFFDAQGRPALLPWSDEEESTGGYARIESQFDRSNRLIDRRYFDANGKPTLHPNRYWRVTYEYDSAGNNIASAYYGLDGEKTLIKAKYHRVRRVFDRNGNATLIEYFDSDGHPTLSNEQAARLTHEYDAYGRVQKTSSFDVDGHLAVSADGTAQVTYEYDELGHETRRRYFDAEGRPTNCADGYHEMLTAFDSSGEISEIRTQGPDSALAPAKDGTALTRLFYDSLSRPIDWQWCDAKGQIQAERKRSYVVFGETADESFFKKGRLTSHRHFEYDDRRRIKKVNVERPLLPFVGAEAYYYDRRGALAWVVYLQQGGTPAVVSDGGKECFAHRFTYSREKGKQKECYTRTPTPAEIGAG